MHSPREGTEDDFENAGADTIQIARCRNHHFTVIGQLSARHNAINLSQGAPNFSCDPKLISGVTRAMEAGYNQYASMTGLQPLRERIADKIATLYGTHYDPASEVLVTASASEGLYSAISGLVHPETR